MGYWKTFWVLGKTERQGILFLLVCIVLSLVLPGWLSPDRKLTDKPDAALLAVLDSLKAAEAVNTVANKTIVAPAAAQLQPFDPNTIDKAGLLAFGLSQKTADSWLRFREKGGKFRKAADIRKLYALRTADADRLLPYVRLEQPKVAEEEPGAERSPKPITRIDLNSADSLSLLTVPGIGSGFASRILSARQRWGGWFELPQLLQVYGVDSGRLAAWEPYISLRAERVTKLAINTADLTQLGRHPLLGFTKAKRIIAYREQHGPFRGLNDLSGVYGMDSLSLQLIAPYLQW
jgi:competence ComEA-like helix-hairpin-helix protein